MGFELRINAPAKLNLHLELLGKRADGYHELETVMLAIDRHDVLEIARQPEPTVDLVDAGWIPHRRMWTDRGIDAELPPASDNLVCRALERFRDGFGIRGGFRVRLQKAIPAAAGLGGASSDAAKALVGAARLHGLDHHRTGLRKLAGEIGSDVPFFLDTDRTFAALATGRGEVLRPLPVGGRLWFVVSYPPAGLSTGVVYARSQVPVRPRSVAPLIDALARGNLQQLAKSLFNRLQEPATMLCPWVDRLLARLRAVAPLAVMMSGSGSACFALFPDRRTAVRGAKRMQGMQDGISFVAATACGG
jgi:4-diphosphocytidyl-2-C-methyl-D-erythritol kinase